MTGRPGPAALCRPGPAGRRHPGLTVVATGAARSVNPAEFARNAPSFYADPVAWLAVAAVDDALGTGPEELSVDADRVAVVALSGSCSAITMSGIAASAGRGMVSPLRFAGAGPGILAGLPCIRRRFRGPTLALPMSPAAGLDAVLAVVTGWLGRGAAGHALIITHQIEAGVHAARCVVVRAATPAEPDDGPRLRTLLCG